MERQPRVIFDKAMSMLTRATRLTRFARTELRYRKIHSKYSHFTMVPRLPYAANLRLAASLKGIPGDIVECGTWRGGMIAGIADILGPERCYRLFDSYEGMPPAKEIDGKWALAWERNTSGPDYHNNCRASELEARTAMSISPAKNVVITKGWFRDTLPKAERSPIAILRLDADWYDSTVCILENFAAAVVPGGMIIVDDYYVFEGCAHAVNEFAVERKWMIRQSRFGGVCYIVIPA